MRPDIASWFQCISIFVRFYHLPVSFLYDLSCWAFGTVEQVESDAIRMLGMNSSTLRLSAQQINSCDSGSFGCNGGKRVLPLVYNILCMIIGLYQALTTKMLNSLWDIRMGIERIRIC